MSSINYAQKIMLDSLGHSSEPGERMRGITYSDFIEQGYHFHENASRHSLGLRLSSLVGSSAEVDSARVEDSAAMAQRLRKEGKDVVIHDLAYDMHGQICPDLQAILVRDPKQSSSGHSA